MVKKIKFTRAEDFVRMYCPHCNAYTIEYVGGATYRCAKCKLAVRVYPMIVEFSRKLSPTELERLFGKGGRT